MVHQVLIELLLLSWHFPAPAPAPPPATSCSMRQPQHAPTKRKKRKKKSAEDFSRFREASSAGHTIYKKNTSRRFLVSEFIRQQTHKAPPFSLFPQVAPGLSKCSNPPVSSPRHHKHIMAPVDLFIGPLIQCAEAASLGMPFEVRERKKKQKQTPAKKSTPLTPAAHLSPPAGLEDANGAAPLRGHD